MIEAAKICIANNSQFSRVHVSPSTSEVNDNNLCPNGKCSREKSYLQNLDLLKLMIFFLNTGISQHNKILSLSLPLSLSLSPSRPCSLTYRQSEEFFWVHPSSLYNLILLEGNHFPPQRCEHPGLRNPEVPHPCLWFFHPYNDVHTLCLATISFCPTTPGLGMARALRILHIYT